MTNLQSVAEGILRIGVNDRELDLFEGQYPIPNGISYNAYVILDEKVCVLDTVDGRFQGEYLRALEKALEGRAPDYLVISHMEPDHSACIQALFEKYPGMKLVGNAKTLPILLRYFDLPLDTGAGNALGDKAAGNAPGGAMGNAPGGEAAGNLPGGTGAPGEGRFVTVQEGDTLPLGRHTLTFVMAPMVHWPEVMVSYDGFSRILFSADALGKFGALDCQEDWIPEARRYYFNIVGKFGKQVEALLKKAGGLDIQMVCPLHGPALVGADLQRALAAQGLWASYAPEERGALVAFASLHGNTARAARAFRDMLRERGAAVELFDLARDDLSEALAQAFRMDTLVLMASSYDAGVMPFMETFLQHLEAKNYQKRRVALVENASFAPSANRAMRQSLSRMREIALVGEPLTIFGAPMAADFENLKALANELF